MVVLNLYPSGTLEYDNKGIRSTGTLNKSTILFEDVIEITFDEPTRLKNGIITIKTTSNKKVSCIFRKKHLDDAKVVYNDLLEIKKSIPTEYPPQKEKSLPNEEQDSKYKDCPICNNHMKSHKSTGFLASGIDYICENCQLKLHYFENQYRLEDINENKRLQLIYKNKQFTLSEWKNICSGHYSEEEDKELSKLEFDENTNISCPICDNLFDKYHNKGILTFDLLVCPICESRFEIYNRYKGTYRFINSPNNDLILWNYYNKELTMNEFYDICGKSNNEATPKEIENNKNNIETTNIELIEQTNESKIEKNIKDKDNSNNQENQVTRSIYDKEENKAIFCQNCGTNISKTSKFCMECGNPIKNNPNYKEGIEENLSTIEPTDNIDNITMEKNVNQEIEKIETTSPKTTTVSKFEEEMLSHPSTPSYIKCPSCNKIMQKYHEDGFLSGGDYHYCLNCNINFKEYKKSLSLNEAPKNTKLY